MRPLLQVMIALVMLMCAGSPILAEEPDIIVGPAFFNEHWLETVVSIEGRFSEGDGVESRAIGTGFLVETERGHVLLVTAKHVITDQGGAVRPGLKYLLTESSGERVLLDNEEIEGHNAGPWYLSSNHDVACRFMAWPGTPRFRTIPLQMFLSQRDARVGTRLLVLGFPLGLRSAAYANPIARQGMVARAGSDGIIADSFVVPGHSGSPVLYSPPLKVEQGPVSDFVNEERVIGLVSGPITYVEDVRSVVTERVRMKFEENTGLAHVVPSDAILELIDREDVREQDGGLLLSQMME